MLGISLASCSAAIFAEAAAFICSPKLAINRPGPSNRRIARSRFRTLQKRLNLKNKPIVSRDDR